jgi:hypothetical protein
MNNHSQCFFNFIISCANVQAVDSERSDDINQPVVRNSSYSLLPAGRVPFGMEYRQHNDTFIILDKEDFVWKAARNSASSSLSDFENEILSLSVSEMF